MTQGDDLLQTLVDSTIDLIFVKDREGRYVVANASTAAIHGQPRESLIGRRAADFFSDEAASPFAAADMRVIESGQAEVVEEAAITANGEARVFQTSRSPWRRNGEVVGMVGIARDVTQRRATEQQLELANILLRTQIEAFPGGVVLIDAQRTITLLNQKFVEMFAISADDLAEHRYEVIYARVMSFMKDPASFSARLTYLYDHPEERGEDELELIDGRRLDRHSVTIRTPAGAPMGRAWFYHDVTERKQAQARALRAARTDAVTGLANRAVFVEALNHAVADAREAGDPAEAGVAVVYLDLDHFKDVNDTLGHPMGDRLLQAAANRLRAHTGGEDAVARFGGDEFAMLVRFRRLEDLTAKAESLIATLSEPFTIEHNEIHVGASIGIDIHGPGAADAETLLAHADVALYAAKAQGRGSYRLFTAAMDEALRTRVTLGAQLREALAADQLFVVYQPQVALRDGRITGVEALVRWRHPERGLVPPDVFIPVAEQMGLVSRLGHWVLRTACAQASAWIDDGIPPMRMAVNLSALQFRAPLALESHIAAALADSGLAPHLLELELTESALMIASRENADLLRRLRDIGVTVAIDDFGTGYSSLDYLRQFPVNRIKIAQIFIDNLDTVPGQAAIVRATIGLARDLGIGVVAEGVETPLQCRWLRSRGCDEAQGFYFATPLEADDAAALLRRGGLDVSRWGDAPRETG